MAFIALGQVHRRVRTAGRRSGDLHERVPALLVLSGQQARVDPAAAGEGEVGRGHGRAVLQGPDEKDDGDAGPLLVLHRAGLGASTPARRSRDRGVLRRQQPDARRSQAQAAGSPAQGNFCTIAPSSRRGRRGSTSVQCTLRGSCPTLERERWRSWFEGSKGSGVRATAPVQPRSTIDGGDGRRASRRDTTGLFRRERGLRRDAGSDRHPGSRQAHASRDVRVCLRGRRQGRADRAPERRRFHASFPGSSSGDERRWLRRRRDRRSAATSAGRRC